MKNVLILSTLALMTASTSNAADTFLCTANTSSSVIPTRVEITVNGSEVSGLFNFNFGNHQNAPATIGFDKTKNDFLIEFANVSGTEKQLVFAQHGYDHFVYSLNFNDTAGVLVQNMQLDCSDEVQSASFMTCTKTSN